RSSQDGAPSDSPTASWRPWNSLARIGEIVTADPSSSRPERGESMNGRRPATALLTSGPHQSIESTKDRPRGWVHVCNGLDPRRDGGMVPSILGMTGALARLRGSMAIVTATPSRLEAGDLPEGVVLEGPESRLEDAVGSADVVHFHGLWQAQTR